MVARRWRAETLALAAVATTTFIVLSDSPVHVPGRDVSDWMWPLGPAIFAVAVGVAAGEGSDLEVLSGRGRWSTRLGFVVGSAVLGVMTVLVAAPVRPPGVLVRNVIGLIGLALCAMPLRPRDRWVPVVGLTMGTWLLGTAGTSTEPRPWAILLHDAGSRGAAVVAVAAFVIGTSIFVAHRPDA